MATEKQLKNLLDKMTGLNDPMTEEIKDKVKDEPIKEPISNDNIMLKKVEQSEKGKRKGKNDKPKFKMLPEQFANFSIGIEKTSLAFTKNPILSEHEETYIKSASEDVAGLYDVPKMVILINYGISMTLPHITRYLDVKIKKEELEIMKLKTELEKMGIDINTQELAFMDKSDRDKLIEKAKKEKELKSLKKGFEKKEPDKEDPVKLLNEDEI